MARRRLTKRQLLSRLMVLLKSKDLKVRRGAMRKEHGVAFHTRHQVSGDVVGMQIVIDPRNCALVTVMVHELLHLYMAIHHRIDLDFAELLEEGMVDGMTASLSTYLHKPQNGRLFQRCVKEIDRRLVLNPGG